MGVVYRSGRAPPRLLPAFVSYATTFKNALCFSKFALVSAAGREALGDVNAALSDAGRPLCGNAPSVARSGRRPGRGCGGLVVTARAPTPLMSPQFALSLGFAAGAFASGGIGVVLAGEVDVYGAAAAEVGIGLYLGTGWIAPSEETRGCGCCPSVGDVLRMTRCSGGAADGGLAESRGVVTTAAAVSGWNVVCNR